MKLMPMMGVGGDEDGDGGGGGDGDANGDGDGDVAVKPQLFLLGSQRYIFTEVFIFLCLEYIL